MELSMNVLPNYLYSWVLIVVLLGLNYRFTFRKQKEYQNVVTDENHVDDFNSNIPIIYEPTEDENKNELIKDFYKIYFSKNNKRLKLAKDVPYIKKYVLSLVLNVPVLVLMFWYSYSLMPDIKPLWLATGFVYVIYALYELKNQGIADSNVTYLYVHGKLSKLKLILIIFLNSLSSIVILSIFITGYDIIVGSFGS